MNSIVWFSATVDYHNNFLQLHASKDDITALTLETSDTMKPSHNPTATELQDTFVPMASAQLEPTPHLQKPTPVRIKLFISFRTPKASAPHVTDQLPVGIVTSNSISVVHVQDKVIQTKLISKALRLAEELHPCTAYKAAGIDFDLVRPRLGFWKKGDRYLDIKICDNNTLRQKELLRSSPSKSSIPVVLASISFMVEFTPNAASDTVASPSSSKTASNDNNKQHHDVSSSLDFTPWITDLKYLASLPENFATMDKFMRLASDIKKALSTVDKENEPPRERSTTPRASNKRKNDTKSDRDHHHPHKVQRQRSVHDRLGPHPIGKR